MSPMVRQQAEVAVIGGGVIGASVAYHCARAGLRVVLLERGEPLDGASGATFAWLGAHLKRPASYNLHSQESLRLYEGLEHELEADLEYSRLGSLTLLRTPEAMARAEAEPGELRAAGFALELLGGEQVRRMEPAVGPDVLGAWHCPLDLEVNPFKLVAAFLRGARHQGAELRFGTGVTGLDVQGGAVRGVLTSRGPVLAERVVCAAGVHTAEIGRMAGVELPVEHSRGQILVSERVPRRLHRFLAARQEGAHPGLMLRQVHAGNVLMGYTSEAVAYDRSNTAEGMAAVARSIAGGFAALRDLHVIRAYAGLRPMPVDGLPILSEVPGRPGLLVAATHSGYTLAPWVGRAVAQHILGRESEGLFRTYGLQRFSGASGTDAGAAGAFGGSS